VEVSQARKKKKAEKIERRVKMEMEIARRVRMGEDRGAIQEELQSESSTDCDSEEELEEVKSEYEDDSIFVPVPYGTMAMRTAEGSRASSNAPEARKHATDKDAA
jgi:hypothetical protein